MLNTRTVVKFME